MRPCQILGVVLCSFVTPWIKKAGARVIASLSRASAANDSGFCACASARSLKPKTDMTAASDACGVKSSLHCAHCAQHSRNLDTITAATGGINLHVAAHF
jgi:hypothetical protein